MKALAPRFADLLIQITPPIEDVEMTLHEAPCAGIEAWFQPSREFFVVISEEEAADRYRWLSQNDAEHQRVPCAACDRVPKEHTFRHRAQSEMDIVRQYIQDAANSEGCVFIPESNSRGYPVPRAWHRYTSTMNPAFAHLPNLQLIYRRTA